MCEEEVIKVGVFDDDESEDSEDTKGLKGRGWEECRVAARPSIEAHDLRPAATAVCELPIMLCDERSTGTSTP